MLLKIRLKNLSDIEIYNLITFLFQTEPINSKWQRIEGSKTQQDQCPPLTERAYKRRQKPLKRLSKTYSAYKLILILLKKTQCKIPM